MSSPADYVLVLVPPLWVGMVLAISFLEAPLKFRAPGVTLAVGLGIGRRVFRALNSVEVVLAVALLAASAFINPGTTVWVLLIAAAVTLAIQVIVIRPPLSKRSDRILAGETLPRSNVHYVYVALELVKVGLLIALAVDIAARAVECLH